MKKKILCRLTRAPLTSGAVELVPVAQGECGVGGHVTVVIVAANLTVSKSIS